MASWLKLYRKFQGHPFWQENRVFSRAEAWLDILMSANYEDRKELIKGRLVQYKRGSWNTSELKLCSRWGWSRNKMRAYLTLLEKEAMITRNATTDGTTITIVNYDFYQSKGTAADTAQDTAEGTSSGIAQGTQTKNNKKVKKEEKDKKEYAEFVSLTPEEYDRLADEFGEQAAKRLIEILDNYKGASGRRYKDDYRAIRSWVVASYRQEQGTNNSNLPRGFASLLGGECIDI